MYLNGHMVTMAVKELERVRADFLRENATDEVGETITNHALAAAAAGLGAAWIPGAGGTVALAAGTAAIWSMYVSINRCMGLKLSKTAVKSMSSAVVTNILGSAASVIAGTAAATALSFVPGVGNAAASVIMAGITYAIVTASGVVYLKLLTNVFKAGRNPEELSEAELKNAAGRASGETDVSQIIREAAKEYKKARKSGQVTGKENLDSL